VPIRCTLPRGYASVPTNIAGSPPEQRVAFYSRAVSAPINNGRLETPIAQLCAAKRVEPGVLSGHYSHTLEQYGKRDHTRLGITLTYLRRVLCSESHKGASRIHHPTPYHLCCNIFDFTAIHISGFIPSPDTPHEWE